jgi:hypothetical protein
MSKSKAQFNIFLSLRYLSINPNIVDSVFLSTQYGRTRPFQFHQFILSTSVFRLSFIFS